MLSRMKKYNYLDMILLYFKLVPVAAIIKMINNVIGALIPSLQIIMTARFLDSALLAVDNHEKISGVLIPLGAIIAISLFDYYVKLMIKLVNIYAENKIRKTVAPKAAEKKAAIKYQYYEHQESADRIKRVMDDFESNIQDFFNQVLELWLLAAQIIGFVIILGAQLWWAAVVFVVTCVPAFIISYKFGKRQYAVNREMTKIERKAEYIHQILTSRDTIEERYLYGYTNKLNEQYRSKYEFARIARKNVNKANWITRKASGMLVFFSGMMIIAILIPMAVLPGASGEARLTIGMFTTLVNAVFGLSRQMQWNIPNQISLFKYKVEYLKDLNQFLEYEEDSQAISLPDQTIPELNLIEFRNVSFRYPGTKAYVLEKFNFKFEAGKHYAIVGMNGAGKTTLTKILTKLYDQYEGDIFINGKELREYRLSEIKALSAVVYQDFCHYPLDIYHNIAIGNIHQMENHEKIEKAVNTLGLSKMVEKMPKKYQTPITKIKADGIDLSGGEWQRIALARLLVNPAPLKILDEPTAALDPVSESEIYQQFHEIVRQNKNDHHHMTISISHRLNYTKLADKIIVIDKGAAAEAGTFDELMKQNGIYAEMFASQSQWYRAPEKKKSGEVNGGRACV